MATTAQRLAEYEDLYRQAQQYDPNKFQNEFEREYNEAVNYNKDLIDQQSSALGELQTVAPTLREKYMNTLISDPTAQMALIAQARQAPITQWSTASNLLNARGQRYQDILAKALGAYQTSAQQANTAAENAWRLYQDALQQDQFNAQLRASRTPAPTGLSLEDILRIAREQGNTQTEARNPVDVQEARYNQYKGIGYTDEEAYIYATKGIPEDRPVTSERGGVLGLLGKIWGRPLDWASKVLYGYTGPKRYSS